MPLAAMRQACQAEHASKYVPQALHQVLQNSGSLMFMLRFKTRQLKI